MPFSSAFLCSFSLAPAHDLIMFSCQESFLGKVSDMQLSNKGNERIREQDQITCFNNPPARAVLTPRNNVVTHDSSHAQVLAKVFKHKKESL